MSAKRVRLLAALVVASLATTARADEPAPTAPWPAAAPPATATTAPPARLDRPPATATNAAPATATPAPPATATTAPPATATTAPPTTPPGPAAASPPGSPAAPAPALVGHVARPSRQRSTSFDFGDYDGVIERLRPLVENEARAAAQQADRIEALRVYGIACVLTNRRVAAEGAFLLLLREEPTTQLDPRWCAPRRSPSSRRCACVTATSCSPPIARTGRATSVPRPVPRPSASSEPPADQGLIRIGGSSWCCSVGSSSVSTGCSRAGSTSDHTFPGHTGDFKPLQVVNIISFSLLLGVTTYGIIDGFVVGARRQGRERRSGGVAGLLRSVAPGCAPPVSVFCSLQTCHEAALAKDVRSLAWGRAPTI